MPRLRITRLATLAAASVALGGAGVAGVAHAAPAAGTPAKTAVTNVKLKGAYAYVNSKDSVGHKPYVQVVFRVSESLPRRFDGLVRARASIGGTGGSIGGVRGHQGLKGNCYTMAVKIVDGKLGGTSKSGAVGTKYKLTVGAKDAGGEMLTDSMTVTLRRTKAGDASGKPLGC